MTKHTNPPCRLCKQPAIDPAATLCRTCLDQLEKALGDIAALTGTTSSVFDYTGSIIDDLDVRLADQHVMPTGTRTVDTTETPHDRAHRIRAELVTAIRTITYAHGYIPPDAIPRLAKTHDNHCTVLWQTSPRSYAAHLLRHSRDIAHADDATTIHATIVGAVDRARSTIDRPADRWYAGTCYATTSCTAELWARPGAKHVQCSACGWTYDLADLRDYLIEQAREQFAPAALISQVLSTLELPITVQRIGTWRDRGRIKEYPPAIGDPRHRPRYRLGDVIDLLDADTERRKDRAS